VDERVAASENTRPIVGFAELEISQKLCRAAGVHRGGELVVGRGLTAEHWWSQSQEWGLWPYLCLS
jgi:hypothetical protein